MSRSGRLIRTRESLIGEGLKLIRPKVWILLGLMYLGCNAMIKG